MPGRLKSSPLLNVDPEVLEYCDDVVLRLRVQATRYRMASLRISQEQTQPSYFWGYFTNYYGNTYSYWTRQESDAARTKRYEQAGAAMDRAEQFQAIAEEGVKVRRSMTAQVPRRSFRRRSWSRGDRPASRGRPGDRGLLAMLRRRCRPRVFEPRSLRRRRPTLQSRLRRPTGMIREETR